MSCWPVKHPVTSPVRHPRPIAWSAALTQTSNRFILRYMLSCFSHHNLFLSLARGVSARLQRDVSSAGSCLRSPPHKAAFASVPVLLSKVSIHKGDPVLRI